MSMDLNWVKNTNFFFNLAKITFRPPFFTTFLQSRRLLQLSSTYLLNGTQWIIANNENGIQGSFFSVHHDGPSSSNTFCDFIIIAY